VVDGQGAARPLPFLPAGVQSTWLSTCSTWPGPAVPEVVGGAVLLVTPAGAGVPGGALASGGAVVAVVPVMAVGAAVAYKGVGAFAPLPAGVYDLFARFTDSTTNKITSRGVSFFGGRVYSVSARGDITITDSTATRRPILDNTPNR